MDQRNLYKILLLGVTLTLPNLALANAGVPMLYLVMPALSLSLIPIIGIECFYLKKKLSLTFVTALKISTLSNIVSTFLGIPMTWLLLVGLQMLLDVFGYASIDTSLGKVMSVTMQAAWLMPYEAHLYWMIPIAGLFLLIPFFFTSYWIEYVVIKKMLKKEMPPLLKEAVRNANLMTYVLLSLWPLWLGVVNFLAMN